MPRSTARMRCARHALSPGMSPYFGSVGYMRARSFAQFKQSMMNWGAPTENQVYADTKATSAGCRAASPPSARTGTACCPCPATAASNGPASGAAINCPAATTRSRAISPPPTR
ncbi:penicillin acylase family protein [Cupriavidus basilensis]